MKMILAVIQPFKLDEVVRSLATVPGFTGMTVVPVRGCGRTRMARGAVEPADLENYSDTVQLELVIDDDRVAKTLDAITRAARTGRDGDGVVFVVPVEQAFRIATLTGDGVG